MQTSQVQDHQQTGILRVPLKQLKKKNGVMPKNACLAVSHAAMLKVHRVAEYFSSLFRDSMLPIHQLPFS